jgi:hypothetical protein
MANRVWVSAYFGAPIYPEDDNMPIRNTDSYDRDFTNSVNARPVTRDEVAYRDGYVRGKSAEQLEQDRRRAADARMYEANARMRADNGVSTGLLMGLVLAAVAAVIGGALYVYNADQGTVTPTPEATTPATPQSSNNDTTIIQRTIERTREVVPAPSNVQVPPVNVEITNPSEPAPEAAPAPAPEAAPTAPAQPEATTTPNGTP